MAVRSEQQEPEPPWELEELGLRAAFAPNPEPPLRVNNRSEILFESETFSNLL